MYTKLSSVIGASGIHDGTLSISKMEDQSAEVLTAHSIHQVPIVAAMAAELDQWPAKSVRAYAHNFGMPSSGSRSIVLARIKDVLPEVLRCIGTG